MQLVTVLDTILWRGPLGIRLLDLARGVSVSDGLLVQAWPQGDAGAKRSAVRSPVSGIYGFRDLPGLRGFEIGRRPASDWCGGSVSSPPGPDDALELGFVREAVREEAGAAPPNFVVSVEDRAGRFLPETLLMCLPKTHLLEVPLFSSPTRPTPAGYGVVRGEVWDRMGDVPAGWALVMAQLDLTTTALGMADERGICALFIPYATALPPLVGSPPHGGGNIGQLTWPLTITVLYQPDAQRVVPGLSAPSMRSLLEQGSAHVYDTATRGGPSVVRALRFGQELVVATQGSSRLLVDPAVGLSPP